MGRSRSKEKPPGAKPAPVAPYLLKTWGPSKKVLWKTPVEALGAVLVLAISIFLASGLRRKLTHSDARPLPTKTASLGFRGGPYFAETCRRAARDALLPCIGLQNRLALLLFPLSLPLPPG